MQGLFDKEVGGRVFASKSGGREASQKAGGISEKFGEAPNSWCGGSSPTASARLHTLHSACLSCRVGGVRVSS